MNSSFSFFHPATPIRFSGIPRPSIAVLKASHKWIGRIGDDSSVTVPCRFFMGSTVFGKKSYASTWSISQMLDWRLEHLVHVSFLGIQHAWDLCRRQATIPASDMNNAHRIWFRGLVVYEKEPTEGEYYPVMVRKPRGKTGKFYPWKVSFAPSCDFHQNDCLAFAKLG